VKKKIYFIGASGLIGSTFVKNYHRNYDLIYTHHNNKLGDSIFFNIRKHSLLKLFKNYGDPDIIIYAAGTTDHFKVKDNKKLSHETNVKSNLKQIKSLLKINCKIIFLSTQLVYYGKKGNYKENDKAIPKLEYAKQKLLIENYIKNNFDNYLIFRLAKVVGIRKNKKDPINSFLKDIKNKDIYKLAFDQYSNYLHVSDLLKVINVGINSNITGIYNVGGSAKTSRYNFYKNVLKINKLDRFKKKIKKCSIDEIFPNSKQPKDTSLDINKLRKDFNYQPLAYYKFIKKLIVHE